ncbi:MAG: hypothetical protein ACLT38_02015 [Akkermansia sp.]
MSKNKMTRSIYPDFVRSSQAIGQIVSLVMPARWMSGENGPYRETQHFIDEMLKGIIFNPFIYTQTPLICSPMLISRGSLFLCLE